MDTPKKERCVLVLALAPEGTTAREANDRLNEYVADHRRGLSVWHDHFVGRHGGAVVFDVRSEDERAMLRDPGPLVGWDLSSHPLTFSLSAVGFAAQTSFTLEGYRGVSLEELAADEPDDPRFWWRERTPSHPVDEEGASDMSAADLAPARHTITTHIVVADASRASDWYGEVFGAVEQGRLAVPDGRLMQVELRFGDTTVMLADEFPEMGVISPLSVGGTATVLHLTTDDADAVFQRAVDSGAEVRQPLQDAFWGERYGQVTDPFGHRWGIAQHLRDVSRAELEHAVAAAFGGEA